MALTYEDSVDVDEITIDVVVDDIEKVRQELNIDQMTLIGHIMFALIVLEYAKKYFIKIIDMTVNSTKFGYN